MRIGIVGLGHQGRKHLASIISAGKKLKLVGICDILNRGQNLHAPLFTNYLDLYQKSRPDVVIISTPNYLHKRMVIDALKAGIHVIKEKPLAVNYDDAYEILMGTVLKKIITTIYVSHSF